MNQEQLDRMIAAQQERLSKRPLEVKTCIHEWGTAYKSSGGRKVCTKCGFVTDKPFETLGIGEGLQGVGR